jgi:hypothetical protein
MLASKIRLTKKRDTVFPFSPLRVSWVPTTNLVHMLRTRTPVSSLGLHSPRMLPSRRRSRVYLPYSLGTHILKLTRLNNFTCVAAYELSVYASLWSFCGGTHILPACKTRYRAPSVGLPWCGSLTSC